MLLQFTLAVFCLVAVVVSATPAPISTRDALLKPAYQIDLDNKVRTCSFSRLKDRCAVGFGCVHDINNIAGLKDVWYTEKRGVCYTHSLGKTVGKGIFLGILVYPFGFLKTPWSFLNRLENGSRLEHAQIDTLEEPIGWKPFVEKDTIAASEIAAVDPTTEVDTKEDNANPKEDAPGAVTIQIDDKSSAGGTV